MMSKELKKEAKSYAKRKFGEEEQAYLHDIIAQVYYDGADTLCKLIGEQKLKINYAKTIIQDLLDNSDEYARQRAIDFLMEERNEKANQKDFDRNQNQQGL